MSKHRQWYVKLDGERIVGPISSSQLKKLAVTGKIGPETRISPDGENWYPASRVKGLQVVNQAAATVVLAEPDKSSPFNSSSTVYKTTTEYSADCPYCQENIIFLQKQLGKNVKCPQCRNQFVYDLSSDKEEPKHNNSLFLAFLFDIPRMIGAFIGFSIGYHRHGLLAAIAGMVVGGIVADIPALLFRNSLHAPPTDNNEPLLQGSHDIEKPKA